MSTHTPTPWRIEDRVIKSSDGQNVSGLVPSRMKLSDLNLVLNSVNKTEGVNYAMDK